MMKIWYTRDNDGDRELWSVMPEKFQGYWEGDYEIYSLICSDGQCENGCIDAIIGKGFHGLRRGGIAELEISWKRLA
jgi:hypothetical protein